MIRLLSLIDTGGPGGAETVFLQTATRLDPAQFRSVAAVSREGWLSDQLRMRGLDPMIIAASGSFNIRYLRKLVCAVRHCRPHVIAAHLYGTAIYASLTGLLLHIPTIAILHGHSDVDGGGRLAALKSAIVRTGARKVIFVSNELRANLAPGLRLRDERCAVIPNGVDTDLYRPGTDNSIRSELGLRKDAIVVGAVGNVRPAKAYDVLLKAAQLLAGRSDRFHFVIAGENSGTLGKELLRLRDDLGLASRVTFLGLRADIPVLLHNFDIFVLSSQTEGFSIACIEAMSCGIPVVATRCGGPQEILDNRSGLLVPTGDPPALADAIGRIAFTDGLGAALGAGGRRRAQDEYSLARMISRYEDLLTQVIKPTVGRPHATA